MHFYLRQFVSYLFIFSYIDCHRSSVNQNIINSLDEKEVYGLVEYGATLRYFDLLEVVYFHLAQLVYPRLV